jgi:hypothetical protein
LVLHFFQRSLGRLLSRFYLIFHQTPVTAIFKKNSLKSDHLFPNRPKFRKPVPHNKAVMIAPYARPTLERIYTAHEPSRRAFISRLPEPFRKIFITKRTQQVTENTCTALAEPGGNRSIRRPKLCKLQTQPRRIHDMNSAALFLLLASPLALAAEDAAGVMTKVAANVERAVEARRQYVYQQTVRATLVRTNGQMARKEKREYLVVPSATGFNKKLVSFQGEYRKGGQTLTYRQPLPEHDSTARNDSGMDAELIDQLTDGLVNDDDSRDGIPRNLFPLRSRNLAAWAFTMKGEMELQGRRTYRIGFEPVRKDSCVHIGKDQDEDNDCPTPWAGEAWIDAAELQPARIDTHLSRGVPWPVRAFFGTNLRQLGFSITYKHVADGVWFPATYGTEFRIDLLFFYKRTITMNLESSGFQKTESSSTIEYYPAPVK